MESIKSVNVYAYNILRAGKVSLDQNYSYLLSRLLHIESKLSYGETKPANIAEDIFRAVEESKVFVQLDRVCLTVSYPDSAKIKIISSFNSDRIAQNEMKASYSCYVSKTSSLFKIKASDVRSYADLNSIVAGYGDKPVQRSMGRIQKMGLRSGITLSLPISNLVSGFLFLNSKEVGAFDKLNEQDTIILCVLKLIGNSVFNKILHGGAGVDSHLSSILITKENRQNRFDESFFKATFFEALEKKKSSIKTVDISLKIQGGFLFPSNAVIYTLVRALESTGGLYQKTDLSLIFETVSPEQIQLTVKNINITLEKIVFMNEILLFSPTDVIVKGHDLLLKFNYDQASDLCDYSI